MLVQLNYPLSRQSSSKQSLSKLPRTSMFRSRMPIQLWSSWRRTSLNGPKLLPAPKRQHDSDDDEVGEEAPRGPKCYKGDEDGDSSNHH